MANSKKTRADTLRQLRDAVQALEAEEFRDGGGDQKAALLEYLRGVTSSDQPESLQLEAIRVISIAEGRMPSQYLQQLFAIALDEKIETQTRLAAAALLASSGNLRGGI